MSDPYIDKIAGELADLALADEKRSDDEKIVNEISEIVGSSSQTLQEAYLTAVRVRRAEKRARSLLAERAAKQINQTQRLLIEDADDLQKATPKPQAETRNTTDGNAPIAMPGRPSST